MLALVLALSLGAAPSERLNYERKCLYCHSEEVTESRKYTEPQWRKVIEAMRRKAPLLITRGDVFSLTRYMTRTLKLVPPPRVAPKPAPPAPEPTPWVVELEPVAVAAPEAPQPEPSVAEGELEQQAFALMQQRCSKCHTLGRVYGRLDTFERSMSTLERMRLKTGSGITDREMKLLEEYLRSQFKQGE